LIVWLMLLMIVFNVFMVDILSVVEKKNNL